MDTRGNRLYLKFLGYAHWFISIRISQIKDPSISVDQDRYASYIVEKYLDTATIKENSKFHKTNLPYDIIFTKEYTSISDKNWKCCLKNTTFTTKLVWNH